MKSQDELMSSIASKTARADDRWMSGPRARGRKSDYSPPENSGEIMLSDAIRGTGRLAEAAQLNFLSDPNARGDVRLYYSGNLSLLKRPCVAIVGTRQISEDGIRRTRRLTRELVEAGVVIVSGLAAGVDSVAHTTAIECAGDTIAVIGTPLSKAYPAENARLQETIYREHLLISQFAPGTKTFKSSFPQRNRLMAVMTDATVVTEASDTSGTLHQAAECTNLRRWLFIAKSVVDDPSLTWPAKFLKYDTCVPLERVSQVTDRIPVSKR
jgi:DNA processing protein